jgi:predicted DsbA family dithiol-disulfide isomerase
VGDALFRGDAAALDAIARDEGVAEVGAALRAVAAGNAERERLGHYLGGMFWYAGEWYSLYPFARSRGRAFEYQLAFARAAFAEGVDTGLRHVCERAGLSFREAQPQLDREDWKSELEANREALFALGLWGVPSFRLRGSARGEPDYATWGQDRLWRLEQEIRRRLGA